MNGLRVRIGLLLVVSGAALSTGCAGTKGNSSAAELAAIQTQQQEVAGQLETVLAAQQTESGNRTDADAEILLTLEDLAARMDRIENQLHDLMDGISQVQSSARPVSDPGAISGSGEDPRAVYEEAYLEVTRGHYELAISGFEGFLRQYPSDDLSDNAVYWIGECFYVQRQFNRSIEAFVRLIDTYPQGDKVPAAMLKIGYAFDETGDSAAAKRYLQALVDQFAGTEEAGKAELRLARMP